LVKFHLEFGQQLGRVAIPGAVENQNAQHICCALFLDLQGTLLEPLGTILKEAKFIFKNLKKNKRKFN
jgi:hypothetical protein